MSMYGSDADALDAASVELSAAADELDSSAKQLASTLGALNWLGQVAIRFSDTWNTRHAPNMRATSDFLNENAKKLAEQARQQREASKSSGTSGGPDHQGIPGAAGHPSTHAGGEDEGAEEGEPHEKLSEALETIERVLEHLGLGQRAIDAVLKALEEVKNLDEVADFLKKIDNAGVADFIDKMGKVLDVASVVINLAQDYIEHDELPTDERLLHAFTDATVRFAVDKGVEYGTEYAVSALLGAAGSVVPVLGTAVGAAVGKVVGWAIAEGIKKGISMADQKWDIMDKLDDQVVNEYRDFKDAYERGEKVVADASKWTGERIDDIVDGAHAVASGASNAAHAVGSGVEHAAGAAGDAADDAKDAVDDVIHNPSHLIPGGLPW